MITTGDVTLPDGRKVHAVERWEQEYMDGRPFASNTISLEIEWEDGTPLKDHEYNEQVSPNQYLHEYVGEQLCKTGKTEYDDPEPF